jgi:SET domain-containing protein
MATKTKDNGAIEAAESDYLYVGASGIPHAGDGLFTAINIYKDEVISLFLGESLSAGEAQLRKARGEDAYFISMPNGITLDSANTPCFARYANDPGGYVKSGNKTNCKIAFDESGRVCIIASRAIRAHEEIFCSYGSSYWKQFAKRSAANTNDKQR